MDALTASQIRSLELRGNRPLVICDVDEVVLHFVRGFEEYIAQRGLRLEPRSYALEGSVRCAHSGKVVENHVVTSLIEEFYAAKTAKLDIIEGAREALRRLSRSCEVVLLTNLPHRYRQARRENLRRHGISFPLVSNSGPKGPAVRAMAAVSGMPCVVVDDYTDFLESARACHPETRLVHFLHDPRFAPLARSVKGPHVRVRTWKEAEAAIDEAVSGAASCIGPERRGYGDGRHGIPRNRNRSRRHEDRGGGS